LTFKTHFVSIKSMTDKENKVYEVAFNIVPTLSDEALAAEFGNLKEALSKAGAPVISEQYPKTIPLAYTMNRVINNKNNKFNSAFFGWVKFEMDPGALDAFKKILDRNENIIRLMIISTVRESTLAPKKTFRPDMARRKPTGGSEVKEDVVMDKEAVDKKLDELVVA